MSHRSVVRSLLDELIKCYDNDTQRYKVNELASLIELTEE